MFIVSLILSIIILGLAIRWIVKADKKLEPIIALLTAFLGILSLLYSSFKEKEDKREMQALHRQENKLMRDSLYEQIKGLQKIRDSLAIKLTQISAGPGSTVVNSEGKGNTIIIGNDQSKIIIGANEKPILQQSFHIKSHYATGLFLKKDNKVFIDASGTIKLGKRIGISKPDGLSSGMFNFDISQFNIVESFTHGALMFKYPESSSWEYCGSSYKFTATRDGFLYFDVNDTIKGDNKGHYSVNVSVYE